MAAATACASPVEGDVCDKAPEVEATAPEAAAAQADEEPTTGETAPPTSDQQQADGKSKPTSEKIWGSFLKTSGLGKVMGGGKKKKEHGPGGGDATVEDGEQEKPQANQGEGTSSPLSPNEHGSGQESEAGGDGSLEQSAEKEGGGVEGTQEQKPLGSGKDGKPKHGEKSSVRDFIRKPVAKIFSHKSTEKAEALKQGKTRSKSLDRLEDPEACAAALDQTDDSQATGEAHRPAHHSTKHMKRWHSFKKMMAQKGQRRAAEDHKDMDSAEGPGSDTQLEAEALETTGKLDHHEQKRWKLKRSWTFQGLKRDPSVVGIHKPKASDKDSLGKGEEAPANEDQGAVASSEEAKPAAEGETQEREEEKGSAVQRAKSVDHHANEIWTNFKKRVIPKSKRASDAGVGGGDEATGEHEHAEEATGKSAKTKRTHFNRAVSLKNFIMRKGKSASVDLGGEAPAEQKEDGAESAGEASASAPVAEDVKEGDGPANQAAVNESEAPAALQNGGDEKVEAVHANGQPSASTDQEPEKPDAKEQAQPEPASGETKAHEENGSLGAGCIGKGSGTDGEDGNPKDIVVHDHETIPHQDAPQETANQGDCNSHKASLQAENACSTDSKDETSLNQQQCPDGKPCSGNPVAESGECPTENDFCGPQQAGEDVAVLDASFELDPILNGPPKNGGAHPGAVEETGPDYDQEEKRKRMLYDAAASIVRTVVAAAAEQLTKEKDLLDNGLKGSYRNNNSDNFLDVDVNYCH